MKDAQTKDDVINLCLVAAAIIALVLGLNSCVLKNSAGEEWHLGWSTQQHLENTP